MNHIFLILALVMVCATQIAGCDDFDKDSDKRSTNGREAELETTGQAKVASSPDIIIGIADFYAKGCSIIQVSHDDAARTETVIFKAPTQLFASCSQRGANPLQYDGEYIIFSICNMTIGAGGCGGARYRSADFELWQEYIGVTWLNSEEYEAWRTLGSNSSKADSIKKVVKD
ncbi:hypothetical protein HWQ46_13860 [Shewanella sp. D64]|uniref:hypothetical protein n=1 Tax=unclassified Shewanella TaxID=196818 RepID=UPI0022BA5170|nr:MULTISPECIES: hypothetical protein [unclassified Shewanella]MEC4726635.1 hypothetical protein [Shewanella sp. D64]MEC4739001.1 hypothetical protein [Shewanella sp. E94]WBJ96852.1 hypothetical protein HWQ47_06965 [Shewanella sp. MTB7]